MPLPTYCASVWEKKVESQEKLPPGIAIAIIEASIDDMNPEFYSYVIEKLQAAGALRDFTQCRKEGAARHPLTVLANPARVELLHDHLPGPPL